MTDLRDQFSGALEPGLDQSYLHIVKGAAAVVLQAQVGEVEENLLPSGQLDHVDTLAVVGVTVGPVGGDHDAVSVGEGATTSWLAYNKTQPTEDGRSTAWFLEPGTKTV